MNYFNEDGTYNRSLYNSNTNQEIKGKFVGREVIENVGELMQHLIKSEDKGDYEHEIMDVCQYPDYESACEYAGWYFDEDNDVWKHDEEINEYNTAQEVCDDENLDYNYCEAYEFWSVSSHLGKKLEAEGEMVQDIFGFCVWGRCTTGQAILLDSVISRICDGMEILQGQKHDWSREAEQKHKRERIQRALKNAESVRYPNGVGVGVKEIKENAYDKLTEELLRA